MIEMHGETIIPPMADEVPDEDVLKYRSKGYVLVPAIKASSAVFHPDVHYENLAETEIADHVAMGGVCLVLQSHFRRKSPTELAGLVNGSDTLKFLIKYTGITARRGVIENKYVGPITSRSGCVPVDRDKENENETPEEEKARVTKNLWAQAVAGKGLVLGWNWLYYPEGGSKIRIGDKKIKRPTNVLMPFKIGFAGTLAALTEEQRKNVKLLAITESYGSGLYFSMNPTMLVSRPESIVEGGIEDFYQQGVDLMNRTFAENQRLHKIRQQRLRDKFAKLLLVNS